jgi:hypothetical protein
MKLLLAAALALIAGAAQARPVLVEMFTSQACSSCPPADALLATLAKDPAILPLSFNVTYWNSPAWTDAYGLTEATDRQTWYAGLRGSQEVYTPEAVVDGTTQLTGSDRAGVTSAIAAARTAPAGDVKVTISGGAMIKVTAGAGAGGAELWLFGFDPSHTTRIGGGENGGATLTEVNVVRSVRDLGLWTGQMISMSFSRPAGARMAAILQRPDGGIIGLGLE